MPVLSAFFSPFQLIAKWTPELPERAQQLASVRIAPTERGVPRGYVHDRNAASLGGVAGHAGLFSSARDLATFAESMLSAMRGNDLPILSSETVSEFVNVPEGARRALGWDVARGRSSSGEYFSEESVGHTGFTGTSIWIDPKRDLYVVLLTNRIHPSASNQKHIALRRAVHNAVQMAIADELVTARAD
jgi:serine-type D-Ala-D-Ala carboxypeptidase